MVDEVEQVDPVEEDVKQQESGEEEQPTENMLSQSQVDAIVKREKKKAAERARKQFEMEYQQMQEQQQPEQQGQQTQEAETPQVQQQDKQVTVDEIYQQLNERFQQQHLEEAVKQAANQYYQRMDEGKSKYDDFEDVTANFDPTAFPQLAYLVSEMDNAADVVYELANNPQKLVTIDSLAHKSPNLAKTQLQKIGASIKQNQDAQQVEEQAQVDEPLNRIQPTRGSTSGGSQSISDLRNMDWLRG